MIIKDNRIVSDHTFATRLKGFLEDVQVNDAAGQEERDYLLKVTEGLLFHQIETVMDSFEAGYLASRNPDEYGEVLREGRMKPLNTIPIEIDKKGLIFLLIGTPPVIASHELDWLILSDYFDFDTFSWNIPAIENLTEEQIYKLYLSCRKNGEL